MAKSNALALSSASATERSSIPNATAATPIPNKDRPEYKKAGKRPAASNIRKAEQATTNATAKEN